MSEQKTITRNEVNWPLKTFKIVKGDKKDKEYLCPDITDPTTWELAQKWIGIPIITATVQRMLKQTFQALYFDNIDETTGEFNEGKFLTEGAEFTSTGLKLKEIRELLAETEEANAQLIAKAMKNPALFTDPAWQKEIEDGNNLRAMYKAMEEQRSRKGKPEAEAEPSVVVS